MTTMTELDQRDQAIIAGRIEALNRVDGPREGDWVDFADGTSRRVSHVWGAEWDSEAGCLSGVQTSSGGSFYLGYGRVSFSGSLYPLVPMGSLTLTGDTRPGDVWIFHHDHHTAHNGIDAEIGFRVYACDRPAPR